MALSHNNWELPNSRTWLAEIDIKSGLDFPIFRSFKKTDEKKNLKIEDEQTFAELNSVHRLSQAKYHLEQTSYTD